MGRKRSRSEPDTRKKAKRASRGREVPELPRVATWPPPKPPSPQIEAHLPEAMRPQHNEPALCVAAAAAEVWAETLFGEEKKKAEAVQPPERVLTPLGFRALMGDLWSA